MTKKQLTPEQASKIIWKVVAVFVILNIFIMWWFFLSQKKARFDKIFSYVPSSIDQAVIIHPNNDKQDLLTSNGIQQFNWEIETILKESNTIIIAQENNLENPSNMIFIDNSSLDKQKLLKLMNQWWETKYIYENLDDFTTVFGKPSDIEKLETSNKLFDNEKLKSLNKIFSKYTISLVSKPINNLPTNSILGQTINSSQYFVAWANVLKDKIDIQTHIIYKENQEIVEDYTFESNFDKYADQDNILFLELWNIAKQTGLTAKVLEENIKLISSVYGFNLDDKDYNAIFDSIDGNMWILVNKSNNIFNLGIAMLLDNETIRSTIKNNIYNIKYLLEQSPAVSQSLSGQQELELIETENTIWLAKNFSGLPPVKLIAEKKNNQTILSLGEPILEWNSTEKIASKKNAIATFQLDLDQTISLYTNFAMLFMWQTNIDTQKFETLKGKILQWQVLSYPDKISILATLKDN